MKQLLKNPVNSKEYRQRFRSSKTVWVMCSYLFVVGAILLGFIYIDTVNSSSYIPGANREFFIAFSIIQVVLIGFMAPGLAAGAISSEREQQTLNILLTTQLTPLSIVVSKLITSLSFIALLVLMSLPLYSFVFLFGGISPEQLMKVFFFFGVNIFFFGSLGLFCSTWVKRTGVSTVTAYGFCFLVGVGTALLFLFLYSLANDVLHLHTDGMISLYVLYSLNPILALLSIFEAEPMASLVFSWPSWIFYSIFYTVVSVGLIYWSAYLLKPVRRWRLKQD